MSGKCVAIAAFFLVGGFFAYKKFGGKLKV